MPSDNDRIEQMLSEAFDQFAAELRSHCVYRVHDVQEAEDIVQEAYTKVCEYLKRGKNIENMKVFLYSVANNLIVDHARSNKSQREKETSLEAMQEHGFDPGKDDTERMLKRLEARKVMAAIKKLDERDYDLLVQRYFEGLQPCDIARKTGESANCVSVRLHRVLKKVSSSLETG